MPCVTPAIEFHPFSVTLGLYITPNKYVFNDCSVIKEIKYGHKHRNLSGATKDQRVHVACQVLSLLRKKQTTKSKNTLNVPDSMQIEGNKAICPIISLLKGTVSIPTSVLAVPFAEFQPQM